MNAHTVTPSRRGSAMIAVVIVLVIIQFAVIGVVLASSRDQNSSVNRTNAAQSFYAAEGVANMAIREIGVGVDEDGDGGIGSVSAPANIADVGIGGGLARATITAPDATTTTVRVTGEAGAAHRTIELTVRRTSADSGASRNGLYAEMWVSSGSLATLSDVPWSTTPSAVSVVPNIDLPSLAGTARWSGGPVSRYGIRLTGKVSIPNAGNWTFYTRSGDGSSLYINGALVVDNDGLHSATTRSGIINLPAGEATFEVRFFDSNGSSVLQAFWSGPGVATQTIIPTSAFSCTPAYALPEIAAHDKVTLDGDGSGASASVDAFDSTAGPYGGGNVLIDRARVSANSTVSSAFEVKNRATLKGDAFIGPGGSVATAFSVASGGTITGARSANTVRYVALTTGLPAGVPATEGNVTWASNITLTNVTRRFNNLTINGNNTTVTIAGSVTLVIDGTLGMADKASIKLNPSATLTLYCAGDALIDQHSNVNTNTGIPTAVTIHMRGTAKKLSVLDKSELAACVYAPFSTLEIDGGPQCGFSGRFLGGTFTLKNKAKLHADVAGSTVSGGGSGGGMITTITGWTYQP